MQPPDGPVADPGVSEGGHAGPGFHLTVHCVVVVGEVYPEELVVQTDALVDGPVVQDVPGCQLHGLLGQRFLQLQQISIFKSKEDTKNPTISYKTTDNYSPRTSGGGSAFCDFSLSICSTAYKKYKFIKSLC